MFVHLSTTTNMELYPDCVLGNWVMKSILMSIHLCVGNGSGCNSPAGFCVLILLH
jgi:hypothetical protein